MIASPTIFIGTNKNNNSMVQIETKKEIIIEVLDF
jgi:hypothetical protein